jgi:hypothetical protein
MKAVVIPLAAGLIFIVLGKPLTGALIMSITMIFSLRLLERQFTERLVLQGHLNHQSDSLSLFIVDATGSFLQQFTGSFFACIFWMTQGNMSLATPAHWITATQTGLAAATVLQSILQVPRLSPLMRGRWRAFIVTSLVVSSVDRCIHPGHFGGPLREALLTGMSAYGLNLATDGAYELFIALLKL